MVVLLVRMARGWLPASKKFVLASALYLALITVLYLVNHFGLHHGRITLFYYFSYSLVPSYVATIALIGEADAAVVDRRSALLAIGCAVIAYLIEYAVYPSNVHRGPDWPDWVWACTAV